MSNRYRPEEWMRVAIVAKPGMSLYKIGTARVRHLLNYHGMITSGPHWMTFDPQTGAEALAFAKKIRNLKNADDFLGVIRRVTTIPWRWEDPDEGTGFNEGECAKLEREYEMACERQK